MRNPIKGVGLVLVSTIIVGANANVVLGQEESAAPDTGITVGFSVPAVDDYYGVVRDSFVAAAEAQGVDFLEGNGDGAGDPTQQIAKSSRRFSTEPIPTSRRFRSAAGR